MGKRLRHILNPAAIPSHDLDENEIKRQLHIWDKVQFSAKHSIQQSIQSSIDPGAQAEIVKAIQDGLCDTIRDSVWDSMWNSVRESIQHSIRDSIWIYAITRFSDEEFKNYLSRSESLCLENTTIQFSDLKPLNYFYERGLWCMRGILKGNYFVVSYQTKEIIWSGNIL